MQATGTNNFCFLEGMKAHIIRHLSYLVLEQHTPANEENAVRQIFSWKETVFPLKVQAKGQEF